MLISEAIIQGLIQGLTEFLPISSSGHLAIFQFFLGIKENNLLFDVALHIGTLISVILIYCRLFLNLIKLFLRYVFDLIRFKLNLKEQNFFVSLLISCLPLFLLFVKLPFVNFTLKDMAEKTINPPDLFIIGLSLILTSLFLVLGIIFSKINNNNTKNDVKKVNYLDALIMGFVQLIAAVFPGLSRSGSTFSTGVILGLDRITAIDFSFLMSIPTVTAAALLELREIKLNKIDVNFSIFSVGIITSAVVGVITIVFFKWLLKNDKTWIFSLYTFLLGMILIFINKMCQNL